VLVFLFLSVSANFVWATKADLVFVKKSFLFFGAAWLSSLIKPGDGCLESPWQQFFFKNEAAVITEQQHGVAQKTQNEETT
jgi:hypothetical protein